MGNEIKMKLIWREVCDGKQNQNDKLLTFESFFMQESFKAENSNHKVRFGSVKQCALATNYKVPLFEVECCILGLKVCFETDIYSKICREWCLAAKIDDYKNVFHWLQPIDDGVYFQKTDQYHDDIQLNNLSFGAFVGMKSFFEHYFVEARPDISALSCRFWHDSRNLELLMWIKHHSNCYLGTPELFKFVIYYDDIMRMIIDDQPGSDFTELYLQLAHPPRILSPSNEPSDKPLNKHLYATTIIKQKLKAFQHWQRVVEVGCRCRYLQIKGFILAKCPIVKINVADKVKACNIVGRLHCRYKAENIYYTAVDSSRWKHMPIRCPFETFGCKYAWNVLTSKSFEVTDQLSFQQNKLLLNIEDYLKTLKCYEKQDAVALEKALCEFYTYLDRGLIISFHGAIKELFDFHSTKSSDTITVEGICLIRRAFITPLRIFFLPPQQHFDNRVLRHFNSEFALRVSIRDDNLAKLTFCLERITDPDDFMWKTISIHLTNGISVAGRKYTFLAASPSQLRDHGIWMYATDDKGNTSADIRKWLGDFTQISNVAKLMARMGQCFSTTEESIQIEVEECEVSCLEDVKTPVMKSGCDPYIFSDGIGMISSDLVEKINSRTRELKCLTIEKPYKPCAFQIRFQGYKGMLVENPKLHRSRICVRESMKKFECQTSKHLEIVKRSAPRSVYLNRPLIMILEQLGVPQNVFLDLQRNMILECTDALLYEKKACKLLRKQMPIQFSFQKLYESGIMFTAEPFFNSLLNCIYRNNIAFLRSKARISIPPECGRNMFGVLDETGTLKYGQVFVQYSEDTSTSNSESRLHIVTGTVVVTKCPCIHPGDVRKFQAIDVEKLHHIKDCIVFPSEGHRPHPDEMAGSDLDGDEYIVLWMEELIFPKPNQKPMHFPAKKRDSPISNPIEVADMITFLCDYIKNDNIGILASAHLVWADTKGIFSNKCLSIARKIPYSLDFAKTGKTEHLSKDEFPKKYPDFMAKRSLNISYRSERALGHLYRRSRSVESVIRQKVHQASLLELDICLQYPGWEKYKQSAEADKKSYESKLLSLLQMFCIDSESELFCGNINVSKYDALKNDSENITLLIQYNIEFLQGKFREKFFQDLGEHAEDKTSIYQKASAWYMVTYDKPIVQFRSFPWCVASVLAELKAKQNTSMQSSFLNQIDIAVKKIDTNNLYHLFSGDSVICKEEAIAVNVIWTWALSNITSPLFTLEEAYKHRECFAKLCKQYKCQVTNLCSVEDCEYSVGIHALEFLKFCGGLNASSVCNHSMCFGGRTSPFVWHALKLYTVLSVTRNPSYIGILSNTSDCFEDGSFESDPVMIPIDDENLENLIREKWDDVKSALKALSGVREINVRMAHNSEKQKSILISSVGTEWHCWQLEELVIRPNLFSLLSEQIERMKPATHNSCRLLE